MKGSSGQAFTSLYQPECYDSGKSMLHEIICNIFIFEVLHQSNPGNSLSRIFQESDLLEKSTACFVSAYSYKVHIYYYQTGFRNIFFIKNGSF
jgi:hypothetical protein